METFITAVASGLLIAGILLLVKRLTKPELTICLASDKLTGRRDPKTGFDHRWAQLRVKTNSSKISRECTAYLVSVSNLPSTASNESNQIIPDKIHLPWSDQTYTIDVSDDSIATADLFRFDGQTIILSCDSDGRKQHFLEGTQGSYRLCIEVVSPDAKKGVALVDVKCQGIDRDPLISES